MKRKERSNVCVGIDPSLTGLGVALYTPNFQITHRLTPKTNGPARLIELRDAVRTFVTGAGVRVVCVEGYSFRSQYNREAMGELGGVLKVMLYETLHDAGIPVMVIAPTKVKKFTTDNGNAKKDLMMREVFRKWGFVADTNDEADAYALARMAAAIVGVTPCDFEYERKVIDELRRSHGRDEADVGDQLERQRS